MLPPANNKPVFVRSPGLVEICILAVVSLVIISLGVGFYPLEAGICIVMLWAAAFLSPLPAALMAALTACGLYFVGIMPGSGEVGLAVSIVSGATAGSVLRLVPILQRFFRDANEAGRQIAVLQADLARANNELDKSVFELLALFEFTNTLGATPHLNELSDLMVETVGRIIRYDACALLLAKEGASGVIVKAQRGFRAKELPGLAVSSLIAGSMEECRSRLVADTHLDTGRLEDPLYSGYRSLMAIPLSITGKCQGVLFLAHQRPQAYTQADLRLAFIIASQAALAVQNANLYRSVFETSITDGLTGLRNHAHFRETLATNLDDARQCGVFLSLLFIDIDFFKEFNDRYGHLVGDAVLRKVASEIAAHTPSDGLAARYGGEEFAVILPGLECAEAVRTAETIRRAVARNPGWQGESGSLFVTISIGVATYPTHIAADSNAITALIAAADECLLVGAKQRGRNRVAWPGSMDEPGLDENPRNAL